MFKIIWEVLCKAADINLVDVLIMEIIVAIMFILNIWLGTVIGTKKQGFDWKKNIWGIFKGINVLLIIFAFCYGLNLFNIELVRIAAIEIKDGVLTTIEVIGVLAIWGKDLAIDVYKKIMEFRKLKHTSYDDVHYNDGNGVTL